MLEHAFLSDLIVRDGHIAGVRLVERDVDGNAERMQSMPRVSSSPQVAPEDSTRTPPIRPWPPATDWPPHYVPEPRSADLEFDQFHPTAMAIGEHFLVSEAVRGEGAILLDEHGHRFMTDIDPKAELAPRDVVARANFRIMQAQGGKPVMLDVSPMRRRTRIWPSSYVTGSRPSTPIRVLSASTGARSRFRSRPPHTTAWATSAPTWKDARASPACMRPANAPAPA